MPENKNASFEDFKEDEKPDEEPAVAPDELTQPPVPRGRGEKVSPVKSQASEEGIRDCTPLMTGDAQRVKDFLAKQPRVEFYIPLSSGEKLYEAYETVTINGYRMEIKKGMMVSLPKPVADILAKFLNIQTTVGLDMRIDNRGDDVQKALY